ncbi:ribonuclease PH [Pajaroellobacter abortibovis]|nr:ribonuclease PH [Pajaroellobacter abortibovis]
MRADGRSLDVLRTVEAIPHFHHLAEGSILYRAGGTTLLCTISFEEKVPPFLEGSKSGWLTAEYQMHPRAHLKRQEREGRRIGITGRTQEIQRLIGRSLRAALDLTKLGPYTITVDCDVLEADGGTRTASITAGFIALALALFKKRQEGLLPTPLLREQICAISVGHLDGLGAALDLTYVEDKEAQVDLNVVSSAKGNLVEVQGAAEGIPIPRSDFDEMLSLAIRGNQSLAQIQNQILASANADLEALLIYS